MDWVWLIIVGAIVGALGRFFNPGRDPTGWIVTILIGIGSLLIAGAIFDGFWRFVIAGRRRDPRRNRRPLSEPGTGNSSVGRMYVFRAPMAGDRAMIS